MQNRISLRDDDSTWEVWLDAEYQGPRGMMIGIGTTRDAAIKDAETELRNKLESLQKFKVPNDG